MQNSYWMSVFSALNVDGKKNVGGIRDNILAEMALDEVVLVTV